MTDVIGSEHLVDISLAAFPQEGVDDTLAAFTSIHLERLACTRCLVVIVNLAGAPVEDVIVASAPPLPGNTTASAIVEHCETVCSGSGDGQLHALPESLGIGRSARHFRLSGAGFLLLVDDRSVWTTSAHRAYGRILEALSSSLARAADFEREAETRMKLSLATRAAGAGFFEWNTQTNEMVWDKGMRKVFGVSPENFCGTGDAFINRLHPDSRQSVQDQVEAFLTHGGNDTGEFSFNVITDQGDIRRLTSHVLQIKDRAGATCLIGISYDISELELARTQSLYRSDFENLLLNLSMRLIKPLKENFSNILQEVLRDVAQFVSADRAYIFEYDMEAGTCSNTHEWCGEGVSEEIEHLQDVPITELHYWVAAHETGQPFILRGVTDLAESHPLRQILEPQGVQSLATFPLVHDGCLEGFIGFDAVYNERRWSDVDISILQLLAQLIVNAREKERAERKIRNSEAALRRSRDQAERLAYEAIMANRAKTEFIARVSHEVRTPLHAIIGLTNELITAAPEPNRSDYLSTILTSGESMLALINDILDFSRIDSDGIKLQNESLDLHELLNQQRSLFNPMAQEKGLALSLEVSPSLPKYVRGDALRIRQILQNLLSNAIKFTDRGTITIEAAAAGATSEAETRTISLGVRDTGIGIPESEFDNLYVPFFQLNEASVVNRGTGLGLPIAKMLTELMDGEISVESTPGAGSYFCAKLQLELAQPTESTLPESYEPKEMSTSSVAGLRVLLAEDNPVNAGLVKLYLNSSGTILDVAGNGAEAVEMHASGHYDAILMDFEMPIMDGLEATRRIRQAESGSSHRVPIIGVTANALDEDIKRCLDAGMNTVLSKPFKKAQLIQMIAGVTSAGGNSKGVAAN